MCELMKHQMRNFPLFFRISDSIYNIYPTCIPQSMILFGNLWIRLNYSRPLFPMSLCLWFNVVMTKQWKILHNFREIKQTVYWGLTNQAIIFHIETDLFQTMFFFFTNKHKTLHSCPKVRSIWCFSLTYVTVAVPN